MKSGILAAETAYAALHPHLASSSKVESASVADAEAQSDSEEVLDMSAYEQAVKDSYIWKELNEVRNLRPSFHNPLGMYGGIAYSGVDSLILKGRTPWTLRNKVEDYQATKKMGSVQVLLFEGHELMRFSECTPIEYPKPDGILSFDILTSVARTGTNHAEGQPIHLRLPTDAGAKERHTHTNVTEYAGLLGYACPAAVYEYQDAEGADADSDGKKFVINSQNCIHVSRLFLVVGQ